MINVKATLLPCPFCGSDDVRLVPEGDESFVVCNTCNAFGPGFMEDSNELQAVTRWNQRSEIEE